MDVVYAIERVPPDDAVNTEELGSKYKFWFARGDRLFKEARADSGEDWAEKVCAEAARALGLPHAQYELALWDRGDEEVRGVVSRNFCSPGDTLILGNELLAEFYQAYGGVSKFRVSAHTVERVFDVLEKRQPGLAIDWEAPDVIVNAGELFVGYLLLDALVGNTDRHHENWGVICLPSGQVHLAPTFDHASSLGCHETDANRLRRMKTRDRNFDVGAFAARARSALYWNETDARPLGTREAFRLAAEHYRSAGGWWIDRLKAVTMEELDILVDEVPNDRITNITAQFAKALLCANRDALIAMEGQI